MSAQMKMIEGDSEPHYKGDAIDVKQAPAMVVNDVQRIALCFLEREWWSGEELNHRVVSLSPIGRDSFTRTSTNARISELRRVNGGSIRVEKGKSKKRGVVYRVHRGSLDALARWLWSVLI